MHCDCCQTSHQSDVMAAGDQLLLPPCEHIDRWVSLSSVERSFYERLHKRVVSTQAQHQQAHKQRRRSTAANRQDVVIYLCAPQCVSALGTHVLHPACVYDGQTAQIVPACAHSGQTALLSALSMVHPVCAQSGPTARPVLYCSNQPTTYSKICQTLNSKISDSLVSRAPTQQSVSQKLSHWLRYCNSATGSV